MSLANIHVSDTGDEVVQRVNQPGTTGKINVPCGE